MRDPARDLYDYFVAAIEDSPLSGPFQLPGETTASIHRPSTRRRCKVGSRKDADGKTVALVTRFETGHLGDISLGPGKKMSTAVAFPASLA